MRYTILFLVLAACGAPEQQAFVETIPAVSAIPDALSYGDEWMTDCADKVASDNPQKSGRALVHAIMAECDCFTPDADASGAYIGCSRRLSVLQDDLYASP